MNHNLWTLLPPCPEGVLQQARVPSIVAQVLYNRGVTDPDRFQPFLNCEQTSACDPFTLPDMHQAVSRIYRGLLSGEKIVVFGDFDADGITATVLLVEGLKSLGASVSPYLPDRVHEGHGLNTPALEEFQRQGVSLVITVDCGMTSMAEALRAKDLGIDIVITDHHVVQSDLPQAVAIINPKRPESTYPFRDLAGVGVAFKLLAALLQGTGKDSTLEDMLELVALGTIADMSPLIEENRYLVKRGLDGLNATSRPGLVGMLRQCVLEPGSVSAESVAWTLAPRLNAAGRLEHARIGYALLCASSVDEAEDLAARLDGINRERQRLVHKYWKKAREDVLTYWIESPIILMECDLEQPPGINGLVAGKLMDEFNRPAVVMQVGVGTTKGSCRSIQEFDIVSELNQCADLLDQFGGHRSAAGFTVRTENLDAFKNRLLAQAGAKLTTGEIQSEIIIDAEVKPYDLLGKPLYYLQRLEPFGKGNPPPKFLSRNMGTIESRVVGNGGQHLKLRLGDGRMSWSAIGFGLGSRLKEISSSIDVVFATRVNRKHHGGMVELEILDFHSGS